MARRAKNCVPREELRARVVELAAAGEMNQAQIARELGLYPVAVGRMLREAGVKPKRGFVEPTAEPVKFYSESDEVRALKEARQLILGGITPQKVANAPLSQLMIAYGINLDKQLLLEGRATSIVSYDNRGKAEDLAARLLGEMERRGLVKPKPPELEGTCVEVMDG